jgi:hypothetical protein
MSQRIFFYAVFLGSVASGCSGSSGGPSESGQGGASASSGNTSISNVTGGNHTGGNGSGKTLSGGQASGEQAGAGQASGEQAGAGRASGGSTSTSSLNGGMTGRTSGVVNGGGGAGNVTNIGGQKPTSVASAGSSGSTAPKGGASGSTNGGAGRSGSATSGLASAGKGGGGKSAGGSSSTGGKSSVGGAAGTTGVNPQVQLPEGNASFDYQIGGAYTPPTGVRVVSRDRNSKPAAGLYNICYVNGFQIQPDEESYWNSQHPSLILKDSAGKPVVDEDWGETLLDTSTAAKRTELASVIGGWITQCKTDGFNAVEIDNLDSYSRSNGLLTQANNVAFMALLSSAAHASGLAIAQKNSGELLGSISSMGTDFAVVEECNRYSECDQFQAAYGNLVFIIEYRQQDFQKGCTAYPELSIVLRDLNVSSPGSSGYVYQGC